MAQRFKGDRDRDKDYFFELRARFENHSNAQVWLAEMPVRFGCLDHDAAYHLAEVRAVVDDLRKLLGLADPVERYCVVEEEL